MNEICLAKYCTGCMACYSACSANAITMISNERGFIYPKIDEGQCLNCKKCVAVCPVNKERTGSQKLQKVFACWHTEGHIREQSTSGGIFSAIAEFVLKNKGVVFGARFNEKFKVIHSYTENLEELFHYRGSKYVQSYIGDSFKQVEKFLKMGRTVLFTGTPCQIAGLKSFLGKDYDNLLTTDIVCHGVPSPLIFEDYIEQIKETVAKDIVMIRFRYKKPSWTVFSMRIDFKEHEPYIKDTNNDPYIVGFLKDLFTRSCCTFCTYANLNRCSDITMGDFWGYISEKKELRNTEQGISLLILNTDKGKELFEAIAYNLVIIEKSVGEAQAGNQCLSKPFPKSIYEKPFWDEYLTNRNFAYVTEKFLQPRAENVGRKISLFFNDHAYLLTRKQRESLLKVKTKIKQVLKRQKS